METLFKTICAVVFSELQNDEVLLANFHGEKSLFVRFNKTKIRQITDVFQNEISLCLKDGGREASVCFPITGNELIDIQSCKEYFLDLRARLADLNEKAFMVRPENHGESRSVYDASLPSSESYIAAITEAAKDVDLAGQLISGEVMKGNANSLGQGHWFESASFALDYSLYTGKEKAVKASFSGTNFNAEGLKENIEQAKALLVHLSTENRVIKPGLYRCYLAPAAVRELIGTISWDGLSQSALQRGNSPFLSLDKYSRPESNSTDREFSELFSLYEDFSLALNPRFNEEGEVAEETMAIVEQGEVKNLLCCTETANEYNLTSNYAAPNEGLRSASIAAGSLAQNDIFKALGTGLYVSNLHYLNWSDRKKGRITGMTRFACFWVEDGKIVAPIKDLRFDETIFNIWGKNLEAVTDFTETELNVDTYYNRGVGGSRCPGMLIKGFNFTL